jgi:hypothetical protein
MISWEGYVAHMEKWDILTKFWSERKQCGRFGLYAPVSGCRPEAGCCENGNEPSGFIIL